jgi:hypothetical protein
MHIFPDLCLELHQCVQPSPNKYYILRLKKILVSYFLASLGVGSCVKGCVLVLLRRVAKTIPLLCTVAQSLIQHAHIGTIHRHSHKCYLTIKLEVLLFNNKIRGSATYREQNIKFIMVQLVFCYLTIII